MAPTPLGVEMRHRDVLERRFRPDAPLDSRALRAVHRASTIECVFFVPRVWTAHPLREALPSRSARSALRTPLGDTRRRPVHTPAR